jgi:hypothetical protein
MSEDPFDFSSFRRQPAAPPSQVPASSPANVPSPSDPFQSGGSGGDDWSNAFQSPGGNPRPGVVVTHPPLTWLWLGIGFAIVGLALAGPSLNGVALYVVGWAIGGPLAITVLTVYARKDTAAQASAVYASERWVPLAYRGAFVICLLAVAVEALRIGHWAGYR